MREVKFGLAAFVRNHPLAFVLLVALLLRLPAVVYSKGYMASDDHYETIDIAHSWLQSGPFDAHGHLTWREYPSTEISRFPLYTLFLYGIMKLHLALGITSLDTMMYGIRLIHAILSLLSVWAMFRIAQLVTKSDKWAIVAGLFGAAHFAMPYLGVRNLIEMVGGHIWMVALLLVYLYYEDRAGKWLVWAGVVTGVAWMVRFQVAMAALPIPFVLWWQARSLKPALLYVAGGLVALMVAGLTDTVLLGPFLGSFVNNVEEAQYAGALYNTSPFIYVAVLLAAMIPPFSLLLVYLAARKGFWREQLLLTTTILSTVLIHSLLANRQERFMIPILPEILLYAALTLAYHTRPKGILASHRKLFVWIAAPSIAVNMALLVSLTLTYSHKGMVEPMVRIGAAKTQAHVLFITPGKYRWFPLAYTGLPLANRTYLSDWRDLPALPFYKGYFGPFDFLVIYPRDSAELQACLDSVAYYTGPVKLWSHVEPSGLDHLLHVVNPAHNPGWEAYIYRPDQDRPSQSAVINSP